MAQPDTSAKPSANLNTSIADQLGPAGDPGGYRAFLKSKGIEYSLTYIGEVLGNATGGARRGAIVEGRLDLQLDIDLDRLAGWRGASLHANAYQIHGTGLSRSYAGNLITVSAIEALPSSRLYEAWFEQKLFDDQLALRIGQLAADTEFAVSQTGTLFINSTFGWPNIMAAILPSGGPIYPLATPGARIKYVPSRNLSFQAGIYNGDPAGPDRLGLVPDPQRRNHTGTSFRLTDPPLVIAEMSYAYNIEKGASGEPGTVTLGGWYHVGRFNSLSLDTAGRALADPEATGNGRRFRGNNGLYGIIDQTIYREPDDPNDGASMFLRLSGSPGDRNLLDVYVDAGIAYKGLFPGRSDDTLGVGFALSRFSPAARRADLAAIALAGVAQPRRSAEAVLEATYQAVLGPGVTLQPDFQYVFKPSGGVLNPRYPEFGRVKNAAVFGLRATIRY
ncbi:carbohydrate porin [Methylobacterium nodulans]|uniref:Carbohydrate-selective porin OprB n=1 Tax=Methylobacterium nodulans (strain LMG 21967 / CNCM I-2342 / ORS 2060) TaxID=460265 RepID=B8IR50_METNO|nr:carbohydrate porin [Methylobacterium nodulans]ACL56752.1 Carbohydrate-selective porin OprB [Methylobacterium nodulans ORS 2060]